MHDIVIKGGTVVTAKGTFRADVGVVGETIAAIGINLPAGKREISAAGKLVLPGGVDPHAHIEQVSASGRLNSDTWESATGAAALGGTTTVIAFAAQHVGMNLRKVVDDYRQLARRGAMIDYSFHLLLADPTSETLDHDVPVLTREGYASIKVFTTYDRLKVDDEQLLDVLLAARRSGSFVCIHAENHGAIKWMVKHLLAGGHHSLTSHLLSHPRTAELEAIERMVRLAALVDQPIMVFHVSTAEGAAIIRRARGQGLKVFGETCPQYLLLTEDDLINAGPQAAKWICSPPLRRASDQQALWGALDRGDLKAVSSDHAPYAFDETGKFYAGANPRFDQVPSGMPGIELRMPLLFDAMVSNNKLGASKFVELTATAPAELYGLFPRKGAINPGSDADIAIWDADRETIITNEAVHDRTGHTPYIGRRIRGWPVTVLRRGQVVVEDGALTARVGSGQFLARTAGAAAFPAGVNSPEHETMAKLGISSLW
jgi:dihydropyrimidinase